MMAQQQFCLKWNNYQSNMSEVFQNMLMNENMVDVTLACEGDSLRAHKMVLAACSPFFQSLFLNNPCQHPIVILKDVRFIDLKAIIDFMYKGEVNVSQEQLSALLKTAETLKVKGLAEVTEKQARGQPQLQSLFSTGTGRKKRKRNKKGAGNKESGESSESDEENSTPKRDRAPSQRIAQPRILQAQVLDKENSVVDQQQQMEPSRILEQSMATAEVGGPENGQDGSVLVASEVQTIADEEGIRSHVLFDDLGAQAEGTMLTLPGPSGGQGSQVSSGRKPGLTVDQKAFLNKVAKKPISNFEIVIDEAKKSPVWHYFGELAYKDPKTLDVSVYDEVRRYCLQCIIEAKSENPLSKFEDLNIHYMHKGTSTANYRKHLEKKHQIQVPFLAEQPREQSVDVKRAKVMTPKKKKTKQNAMSIIPVNPEDILDEDSE
ncbi:Protein bric-a-brac 2 [Halotydeus destructor]|nr:Protein bric-a-brac 2 [Halotydeus destructor]